MCSQHTRLESEKILNQTGKVGLFYSEHPIKRCEYEKTNA